MILHPVSSHPRALRHRAIASVPSALLLMFVVASAAMAAEPPDAPADTGTEVTRADDARTEPAPAASDSVDAAIGAALPTNRSGRGGRQRIVVHLKDLGDSLPTAMSALLEGAVPTADGVRTRFVDFRIGSDQVRYFHADDEPLARSVAARLMRVFGDVSVRDFTQYRPQPEPGLVEVWVR